MEVMAVMGRGPIPTPTFYLDISPFLPHFLCVFSFHLIYNTLGNLFK